MLNDLLGVAGLTVLIMITAGADLALVTRNTVMGGKSAGVWTSAGVLTGNLIHLMYCLLGIGRIANSILAFTILKLAGGLSVTAPCKNQLKWLSQIYYVAMAMAAPLGRLQTSMQCFQQLTALRL
jgi:hypothetical protein